MTDALLPANPTPNTDDAIKFLEMFAPTDHWVLAAIRPEGGGPEVKTFGVDTADDARAWIDSHNGKRNLYFQVNPPLHNLSKKASKKDIKSLDWLHVDVDPRAGEDIVSEQKRILALFTENRPESVPEPTIVIFSGGGYQAFWRLQNQVPINGNLEKAADAERYNKKLEELFGGDSCHNVDRIMRLPGTINLPNALKRKKGRREVKAELIEFNNGRTYNISEFIKTTPVQLPGEPAFTSSVAKVEIGGDVERVMDLDELDKWNVPNRVKIIIAQGRVPDEKKEGDDTRSAWLFDAVCNLLRKDVPDQVIYAILTDPEWGIAESVVERKSGAQKYALRTIEQAKGKVAMDEPHLAPGTLDEEIERINNEYFAALAGGKVRFWRENKDNTIEPMDTNAFKFELAPRRYKNANDDEKPVAPVWMQHPSRRYYRAGFALDPDAGRDGPAYNLWRGFKYEPAQGDWSLMRAHITDVLASGDADHADYIIKWTAWSFQNPATPPRVALVFRGGQGIGKGMFAGAVADIFGTHGMRIQNMNHLVGKFNAHLRHLCLLFADEAVVPNSDSEGTLKGLITEHTIPIEAKGVDVVNAENHLRVIMATNNEYAVPAAGDARRFAVFDVSNHQKGKPDYFAALATEMGRGGQAAMLHDMLAMPLDNFHPERCRPNTDALSEQMNLSMQPAEMAIQNMLREGEVPCEFEVDQKDGRIFVATTLLVKELRLDQRQITALGNLLRKVSGTKSGPRVYVGVGAARRQYRGVWLPPLGLARQNWERHIDRAVKWPEDVATWAIEPKQNGGYDDASPF